MERKCPINEMLVVIDALLSETTLEESSRNKVYSLKHLLTRFTYNDSQFIDLSRETEEYKQEVENILDKTYTRGLGNWKKGESIHLCHVINAMVNLVTKARLKSNV